MGKKKVENSGYVSRAKLTGFRVSPRKARLVVDLIRGKRVEAALDILNYCEKKTAPVVRKLILSAVSNASSSSVDVDELMIRRIWVNQAQTLRRSMPRARGSASPILKRFSTITVELDEIAAV